MIHLNDREKELALARAEPPSRFSFALAELNLYWDNHPQGRPDVGHEAVINIRLKNEGTEQERVAAVEAVARWLGVGAGYRNGTHFAQRRFGTSPDSILIEAHYTPNPARAVMERQDAAKDAPREPIGATA